MSPGSRSLGSINSSSNACTSAGYDSAKPRWTAVVTRTRKPVASSAAASCSSDSGPPDENSTVCTSTTTSRFTRSRCCCQPPPSPRAVGVGSIANACTGGLLLPLVGLRGCLDADDEDEDEDEDDHEEEEEEEDDEDDEDEDGALEASPRGALCGSWLGVRTPSPVRHEAVSSNIVPNSERSTSARTCRGRRRAVACHCNLL
eukprot:TRINITY_DN5438_c0_g1_i2.p3 TRINITY_DN5438_c0_g1~~TRINITY_DN5438_c0_g1_i2.p3  ORF type:complete len:202 (-),score=28.35 TRINITY_DN5438_c0_g1_i2:141-746(-)